VIDLLAPDTASLLAALQGHNVTVGERTYPLETLGARVQAFERSSVQKLYDFLSNPSLLYVLLLMGIFGLYIEFNHPGLIVPGLLGAVCLGIVFGLQALPINWFGAGLIGLAAVLFVAEIYVTSFGLLGFAGLCCLIAGSYILFSVPGSPFEVDRLLIWTVSAAFATTLIGLGTLIVRAQRQGASSGADALIGLHTSAVEAAAAGGKCRVFVDGAFWNAVADEALSSGQTVEVVGRDGLTLKVRPVVGAHSGNPGTSGPAA
jgi:membrane-bound serine protease (ClpP class)